MIVQCPNCSTKYNFDESGLNGEVRVRCTRCKHVFSLFVPEHVESQDDSDREDLPRDEKDTWNEQDSSGPGMIRDETNEEISPPQDQPPLRSKRFPKKLIFLSLLLILALGILIALSRFGADIKIPFISQDQDKIEIRQQTEFSEEDVKDISLENIRQYFVSNDKAGQLFVIEGQAVNNFNVPKSMIKLRVSLYDSGGSVLREKDLLCGNMASLFQLQVSSQEELESILQSRLGVLTSNKHVAPGNYTPFMIVFYNPPDEMQEFGIEVIEAHDPTP